MKHSVYGLIVSTLLFFASCGETRKDVDGNEHSIKESLDGYWILSNYIDGIRKTKSIAPHTGNRLTWDAIVIKIYGDSLATHGLIMENKVCLSDNMDSLTTIEGLGRYKLSYDIPGKQIIATSTNESSEERDTLIYQFRRVKPVEQRLIDGIDGKRFFENLEHNFYNFFIDSIISGTYKPLDKTGDVSALELGKGGRTSGFKNYNKYSIHDYFGTLHGYGGNDAIVFEDTTILPNDNAPPTNIAIYSWRLNGDTLQLTKMLTETEETFFPGTKTHKLLRTKQHSR